MKLLRLISPVLFLLLFAFGCSEDDSTSPGDLRIGFGTLSVALTDAPGDYDAVNVTFSEVAVHYGEEDAVEDGTGEPAEGESGSEPAAKIAGEWIVISGEEQTFDLLTLSDGITAPLGEAELTAGHYTQLRLIVTVAEVVIDGESFALDVPSGTVKFVSGFEIADGEETKLIVDFDADRSVHQTGNGQYKLQPVIRLVHGQECGSIAGTVTNLESDAIAYAMVGGETSASSPVNGQSGHFTIPALLDGTYTVVVEDADGRRYEQAGVTVTLGQQTDIGDITVQ